MWGPNCLKYLLTGLRPDFDPTRLANSTVLLLSDLLRQGNADVRYERDVQVSGGKKELIEVPILATRKDGTRFVIALSGPLTTDYPADARLLELAGGPDTPELIVVNEHLVRGNLPAATGLNTSAH